MKMAHPAVLTALLLGAAVMACGQSPEGASGAAPAAANLTANGVNATNTLDSWGGGYCTNITLANTSTSPVTSWTLVVAMNGTTLNNIWGGTGTVSGGSMTIKPVDYDANIAPGASVTLGFCGTGSGTPTLSTLSVVGGGGDSTTFLLTVSKSGDGSGTVLSTPAGIDCGSTCSASFSSGAVVTLTANAASGSVFTGWSGACSGVAANCTVAMASAQTAVASFGAVSTGATLTVVKAGAGSGTITASSGGINCGSTCSATFTTGATVTLTASAASGSTFAGWSSTCPGFSSGVVAMNASCAATATFDLATDPGTAISVNAGGAASGAFVADAYFSGGSTYSVTTTIDTTQLSGTVPAQAVLQSERYGEFTYTIPNRTPSSAQTVTLYFAESFWTAAGQRTFNVAINGATVLTAFDIFATAGGTNRAIARTFNATASASGQVVIQFTKGGGPDNPKVSGITVAPGVLPTYTLSVTRSGGGSGTVSGGGINCGTTCSATVPGGSSLTLTAAPDARSSFAGWGGSCSGVSPTCTVAVSGDKAVTATFEASSYATVSPTAVGGASRVADAAAYGGYSVALAGTGQGAQITGTPAAASLALHYASVSVGTIGVSVNGQAPVKVNVHSSGALVGSFLYAVVSVAIPANATVTISRGSGDVQVNLDKVLVGNGNLGLPPDIWNLPAFPIASGPYAADWKALGLAYSTPQWWRDAKLGAWAHWDPQSMPEQGDWYAYRMYQQGSADYTYHLAHFGHPSVYGYKDICKNWLINAWDPSGLMDLYVQMGARFFMAMGVHHDNFDCWDSTYQPWNSVRVGVKRDIVGTWAPIARQKGLRFGVGFHNTPARTWGQWMPVRYTSDSSGTYKGVSYDALQTILDGKGKWWEGMDPADLYGYRHSTDCSGAQCNTSPYATQFLYRVDDAIQKYHPDVIYFDDHAGDSQVDLGVHMGLGPIATKILANYYNRSATWNQGKMDVVVNMKGVGGTYDSFQTAPTLLPFAQRALVRSTEAQTESQISAYPFQTEVSIQDWHYKAGQGYTDAATLVTTLMQNVSRNGSLLLNLTQRGQGNLDAQCIQIAQDIGAWLKVHGEAVYGSRPFEVFGDSSVLYTRNNGNVYATLLGWNGGAITLGALKSGGVTLGRVSKVELLGSGVAMTFSQSSQGLTVTPAASVPALSGISNATLAAKMRVLRVTHDKGWINDDDPGASSPGWLRKANLGTGDYNNDLTTSTTAGDVWSSPFTGTSVAVYAPIESGAGTIEIQVDGQLRSTANLSTTGARQPQQLVAQVTGLASGPHTISIVNRGPGPVAVDAIVAR